ncbi:MAG: phosphate ABC transporter substrate-binding/OmpA family protein [Neomegalonema sp.]|nr:phosphate ABC transporter substrate-binding/OmpA family protein [Neomegalonema sp.]
MLFACLAAATPSAVAKEKFEIHGSNTIGAKLMPALIEAFGVAAGYKIVREPGTSTEVETIRGLFGVDEAFEIRLERFGSSTSFKGLLSGAAVLGMSSRPIKDKEVVALKEADGVAMREPGAEHIIALDGLTVIVHKSNPLPAISLETAARIFAGDIKDWSELGLPAGPIAIHARDNNSGTWDTFKSLVLKPAGLSLTKSAIRYASNEKLGKAVASDPKSIGFVPLAFKDVAKPVPIALECGMVVRPDRFVVKAEEYPLGRRLYIYTKGAPKLREASRLLTFATSDAAQAVVGKVGFVNQEVEYQDFVAFSNHIMGAMQAVAGKTELAALKRMIRRIEGYRRLSTTFRFEPGGVLLDAKSIADAGRLARWLMKPENRKIKIRLIGFADSVGGYEANLGLSLERAKAVRRAVLILAGPGLKSERIRLHGFSTVAPIACNSTASGRAANRRVEVWASQ